MKTLTSFAELGTQTIGKEFGKLIKATKRMPTMTTFERGRLTKVKFTGQKGSYFVPFVSGGQVLLTALHDLTGKSKEEKRAIEYKEYTVDEFINVFGSLKK